MNTLIKNIDEWLLKAENNCNNDSYINCFVMDKNTFSELDSCYVYSNGVFTILVLSGSIKLNINYKNYNISKNKALMFLSAQLFQVIERSADFKAKCVYISKVFMQNTDPAEMIGIRTKYGIKLFNLPVVNLNPEQIDLLSSRIDSISAAITNRTHTYRREMILNAIIAFSLDLSNFIDYSYSERLSRQESFAKSFMELLMTNYRKEHNVDFYASKLNITSHYLTVIIKNVTGQSVSDFIYELLYSEARTLLSDSRLSIQEISNNLNFSDQSAFGKFFKRKAGVSPKHYQKKYLKA